ncbi:MAG: inositol monophosphatase [Alphaproteobacteria bacterium]|nr:inositol monophosphatase [Alphaproteobacteria bacterium]
MTEIDQRELALLAIAREAGELARRRFLDRSSFTVKFKGPQDFITEADGEVERLILGRLRAAFPDDTHLGEETGGTPGRRAWVIDPIDGTANFARGIAHFCVSIAFVEDGKIRLGAIYQPMTREMFAARKGQGASLDGRPMRTNTTANIEEAAIELGWSKRRSNKDYTDTALRLLEAGASFRRCASGALGLASVADGRTDAYFERHINSWDCLAGILMVREAGGWTNDFLAGDGLLKGNPVLATNAPLKDVMAKLVEVERG